MARADYDPIGAMSGLFAPAWIYGDPESMAAVKAWNAKNYKKPPPSDEEFKEPSKSVAEARRDAIASALLYQGVLSSSLPGGGNLGGVGSTGAPSGETGGTTGAASGFAPSPGTPSTGSPSPGAPSPGAPSPGAPAGQHGGIGSDATAAPGPAAANDAANAIAFGNLNAAPQQGFAVTTGPIGPNPSAFAAPPALGEPNNQTSTTPQNAPLSQAQQTALAIAVQDALNSLNPLSQMQNTPFGVPNAVKTTPITPTPPVMNMETPEEEEAPQKGEPTAEEDAASLAANNAVAIQQGFMSPQGVPSPNTSITSLSPPSLAESISPTGMNLGHALSATLAAMNNPATVSTAPTIGLHGVVGHDPDSLAPNAPDPDNPTVNVATVTPSVEENAVAPNSQAVGPVGPPAPPGVVQQSPLADVPSPTPTAPAEDVGYDAMGNPTGHPTAPAPAAPTTTNAPPASLAQALAQLSQVQAPVMSLTNVTPAPTQAEQDAQTAEALGYTQAQSNLSDALNDALGHVTSAMTEANPAPAPNTSLADALSNVSMSPEATVQSAPAPTAPSPPQGYMGPDNDSPLNAEPAVQAINALLGLAPPAPLAVAPEDLGEVEGPPAMTDADVAAAVDAAVAEGFATGFAGVDSSATTGPSVGQAAAAEAANAAAAATGTEGSPSGGYGPGEASGFSNSGEATGYSGVDASATTGLSTGQAAAAEAAAATGQSGNTGEGEGEGEGGGDGGEGDGGW